MGAAPPMWAQALLGPRSLRTQARTTQDRLTPAYPSWASIISTDVSHSRPTAPQGRAPDPRPETLGRGGWAGVGLILTYRLGWGDFRTLTHACV